MTGAPAPVILAAHLQRLRLDGYAPATIRNRRSVLTRFAAALPVPLLEAGPAMLAAWRADLTLTRKAIANYSAVIADFYAWAALEGHCDADPAAALRRRPGAPPGAGVLQADLARYLDHLRLRGLSSATIYDRRRALVRMSAALPVPLAEATAADLLAWRTGLAVSDDTAVHYVSHARELYGWLQAEGLRPDNPAARIPVPRLGRRLPRPVAESDLMLALDAAPPRIRPWLVLAAFCGLRACEIAGLRRESVKEAADPPVLIVARAATKGRNERVVPLSPWLVAEMGGWDMPASGYVFRRRDGRSGPCPPGLISHHANIFLHEIGVSASLHACRHRYGTQIYAASLDIRVTQEMLGHSSPGTTASYAAYSNVGARAAVCALPVPGGQR